ncbi:MAG: glucuronate isomerase [Anaerolineaceae bacterium]|nr:glucuronate isomerase [Anaerolineaceae bacterium]
MANKLLSTDRFFSSDPDQRLTARKLYDGICNLPIVSPHGHVDPALFSDPHANFGTPAELFIIPDHYVTRMLYSQGIAPESLGVPRQDGGAVENDHRKIWQLFCNNFYLFRGTPSGVWLLHALSEVFGVDKIPNTENADRMYDFLSEKLASPEFAPRALFERFNIEVMSTTDAAQDSLTQHQAMHDSGWKGNIVPCFRPDNVVNLDAAGWRTNIDALSAASNVNIMDYGSYIKALENRRQYFKQMGATATDHAVIAPLTIEMDKTEAERIFQSALQGKASVDDAARFTAHMLMEMARMSCEDGLVMQLHPGSLRNHNEVIFQKFGLDKGCDIPVATEYTNNLRPLLNKYGNDSRLILILFTLDESNYSRELATLAGHYPAIKLGPPWWFHDSLNGMARYFDQVMETAGLYNTAGFNDDTRAFCSIPARHDVWRRASANWVAGLLVRHMITQMDAEDMMQALTVGLVKRAYRFS